MAKNTNVKNHKAGDIFEYAFNRDSSRPEEEKNSGGGLIVIECDGTGANFQTFECRLNKMDTLSIIAGLAEVLNVSPGEMKLLSRYMEDQKGLAANPPKSFNDLMGKPDIDESDIGGLMRLLATLLDADKPKTEE